MSIVVVTRLRLRDHGLLDDFFGVAVALLEQAKAADGILGADALADANDVWWTVSAWRDRGAIEGYVRTDPHGAASQRIGEFCDEATFVDWEQEGSALPDWQTSHRHIVAGGQVATLPHPSAANATREFPPPVEPPH
jgi:quinol monooxygenase YgiN